MCSFLLLKTLSHSVGPSEARNQHAIEAEYHRGWYRSSLHGFFQLSLDVNSERADLGSIENVNLEGFLQVATHNEVVCEALNQVGLRIGHWNGAAAGHFKVFNAFSAIINHSLLLRNLRRPALQQLTCLQV